MDWPAQNGRKQMVIMLPKNEIAWVTYRDSNSRPAFVITSKENNRQMYFIYSVSAEGELKKIGKSSNPQELADKFVKF